jgi:hypothetical protein
LAALAVTAGCGGAAVSAGAGSARDDLRQAAEAALSSKSFVQHRRIAGEPQGGGEATIVYQAPDRARTTDESGRVDTIAVGRTVYWTPSMLSKPVAPVPAGGSADTTWPPAVGPAGSGAFPTLPDGGFWRSVVPASSPPFAAGVLAELRLVAAATHVDRAGSTYHYRTGTGREAVSGDAHIAAGRIADFTFVMADPAFKHMVVTFRIDGYDAAEPVDAPPAGKVVDLPAMEPCRPDGQPAPNLAICDASGLDSPEEREVTLPPPTITKPSPLQLRPVRVVRPGTCGPLPENPAADRPASLAGPDGCYDLGPAVLTVRRAGADPQPQPDGVAVLLDLNAADTAILTGVLGDNLGKQVAMVMFGRVQSAPTVHNPGQSDGRIAVSGVDPQTAANIIRALS